MVSDLWFNSEALASRWGWGAFVLISFARLRTGASALYFLVYEWNVPLKEKNDIYVGLGKLAF